MATTQSRAEQESALLQDMRDLKRSDPKALQLFSVAIRRLAAIRRSGNTDVAKKKMCAVVLAKLEVSLLMHQNATRAPRKAA